MGQESYVPSKTVRVSGAGPSSLALALSISKNVRQTGQFENYGVQNSTVKYIRNGADCAQNRIDLFSFVISKSDLKNRNWFALLIDDIVS
jgi:hypothetical protein